MNSMTKLCAMVLVSAVAACGGQEAVLKLYLDAGQARSRRQYDGQQIFAPFGLAPRPIWVDRYPEGLSRQVLIYEWLPGDALDPANPGQMAALARSVAQVHANDASEVRRFSPNPINLDYVWRILRGSITPIQGWLADTGGTKSCLLARKLANLSSSRETAGWRLSSFFWSRRRELG